MDSENQLGKPSGAAPPEDSQAKPGVGSEDSAAGTTIQRLFPEMRRPKPNQEAIAAALQAMQRLTMKMDSESAAEESAPQTTRTTFIICSSCGHKNREANKFCGMCGLSVEASPDESPALNCRSSSCQISGCRFLRRQDSRTSGLHLAYLTERRKPSAKCIRLRVRRVSITITIITITTIFRVGWKAASAREGMRRRALAKPTA